MTAARSAWSIAHSASFSSMATVRLENFRSCSGEKPTISRVPLRSGPHSTPRRAERPRPQLLGVDAAGGALPLIERAGIEGDGRAVIAHHQIGDHAVGVQLRIAVARRAVHEGRHRETAGRHAAANAAALLTRHGRLGFEHVERRAD